MDALHYKLRKLNELPNYAHATHALTICWLQAAIVAASRRPVRMPSLFADGKPQSWLQAVATFMAASLRHITGALILEARRV